MSKITQFVFAAGVIALGWVLTALFYEKIGLLVFLTPAPYVVGYGIMELARYRK